MRGKRAKTYKKLMEKFSITFGFREPYQVLVDAEIVHDTSRFAMELIPALERTLRGKAKPMITQCSMRHLYARKNEPGMDRLIEFAKTIERRFCGHHPDDHPEPLSTLECFTSIVDPKGKGENKHRYVVASQEQSVRKYMRRIAGVPLIYVNRSVMIMEPMTDATQTLREKDERAKFRAEIKKHKGALGKRKRTDGEGEGEGEDENDKKDDDGNIISGRPKPETEGGPEPEQKKKKKKYGKKEPNPLSIRKAKKSQPGGEVARKHREKATKPAKEEEAAEVAAPADPAEPPQKKLRKRRGKKKRDGDGSKDDQQAQAAEASGGDSN